MFRTCTALRRQFTVRYTFVVHSLDQLTHSTESAPRDSQINVNETTLLPASAQTDLISRRSHQNFDLAQYHTLITYFQPYGHSKTAEQRTIIQQYGDRYADRWWVGCYIWYSEQGPGRAATPPRPLLAVPNVTATHQRVRELSCSQTERTNERMTERMIT